MKMTFYSNANKTNFHKKSLALSLFFKVLVFVTRKGQIFSRLALFNSGHIVTCNKTPKVVSVGCVGPWKHNGVLSEFGKIRETGKICHVMSIDE